MARYRMSDGMVVDTSRAVDTWSERTRWDGKNQISLPTGSQWNHQALHQTRRGRFWIESWSQWQGSTPSAEWVSLEEAARWLLLNKYEPGSENWPTDLLPASVLEKILE